MTPDPQFNRVLQNRAMEQAGRYIAEDLASRFLFNENPASLSKPVANTTPKPENPKPRRSHPCPKQ